MHAPLALVAALLLAGAPAAAAPPDAATVMKQMKAALEPARPSTRKLTVVVSSEEGEASRWTAAQARKRIGARNLMLTVMVAPSGVRGTAFLLEEGPAADAQWVYIPTVRRARQLMPVARYQAFLGSDFTYADLGFVSRGATYELLGTEQRGGAEVYRVQEVPAERWYYARVVTSVASDTWLPVVREFYDPSNTRWKVEHFEDVKTVDGVPTPHRIRMEDVRAGGSSEIAVSDLHYDADLPDTLFDPQQLKNAASHTLWRAWAP
jgi:uncharacterized protein